MQRADLEKERAVVVHHLILFLAAARASTPSGYAVCSLVLEKWFTNRVATASEPEREKALVSPEEGVRRRKEGHKGVPDALTRRRWRAVVSI